MPHWNMYCSSPVVFRHTDFPPAFGPEISSSLFLSVSVTVSGTICRPSAFRAFSSRGCLALRRLRLPSSDIMGIPAMKSSAVLALAMRKSVSPMNSAPLTSSGIYGLRNSLNS